MPEGNGIHHQRLARPELPTEERVYAEHATAAEICQVKQCVVRSIAEPSKLSRFLAMAMPWLGILWKAKAVTAVACSFLTLVLMTSDWRRSTPAPLSWLASRSTKPNTTTLTKDN